MTGEFAPRRPDRDERDWLAAEMPSVEAYIRQQQDLVLSLRSELAEANIKARSLQVELDSIKEQLGIWQGVSAFNLPEEDD